MKNRLLSLRDKLSGSYWFLPTVIATLAILLSILTIKLDQGVGSNLSWVSGLIYVDSPEGARGVMSTIASSMITVAGVVFSLTMVVLSLTSQQYGPLVLGHLMRDRGNQFVLGIFTATFIYCLLILRTIRGVEDNIFVPHISVFMGLVLSIISLAVLIYFINHVSQSIQAPNIIARISDELLEAIDHLFPAHLGKETARTDEDEQQKVLQSLDQSAENIPVRDSGYLQLIDDTLLLKIARTHNLVMKLDVLPGDFLYRGQTLVSISPLGHDRDAVSVEIQNAFILGMQRTRTQDIEYIFIQLTALAVRALSPGVNDPYTAIMVIDHLGEVLHAVLERQLPSLYRYDENNHLRVIASKITFARLFHTAFDQISHYGWGDPKVVLRLLHVFKALWDVAEHPDDRRLIQEQVNLLYNESRGRIAPAEAEPLEKSHINTTREFEQKNRRAAGTQSE